MLGCIQLLHAVSYELQRSRWQRARQRQRHHRKPPGQEQQEQQQEQQQQQQPSAEVDAAMCRNALALALVLALLPTQFFYSFLYYTDVASMAALLLTQLLLLRGARHLGALAAAAAVGVRQTNAVWVTVMIGAAMLEEVLEVLGVSTDGLAMRQDNMGGEGGKRIEAAAADEDGDSDDGRSATAAAVRRRMAGTAAATAAAAKSADPAPQQEGQQQQLVAEPTSLLGELAIALPLAWQLRGQLLARYWMLLLVPAAFVVFVKVNGGITVGDREAHAPVLHLVQPLYFGLFTLATAGPLLIAPAAGGGAKRLLHSVTQRPALELFGAATAVAAAAAVVQRGTLAHPYLLADNRHYTFYIWRRVFERHWAVRYLLIPAELLGWRLLMGGLAAAQRRLWCVAFAAAVVVTLAPAWLVEFRYFTPGQLLALLHLWLPRVDAGGVSGAAGTGGGTSVDWLALLVTGLGYAVVNAVTLYVFVVRPFTWPDGSTARFMW